MTTARMHGLDTLRAAAIVLVMLFHYQIFVSHESTFGVLGDIGWVGVDLFFALSGYLIGHQILSALANRREFSLKTFYIRRFLRTLPNYYVVLALYFLIPWFRGKGELPPLWKFLSFTQNYDLRAGTAFSHAWSLCVEEQFYLLLPAVALVVAMCRHARAKAWIVLAAALVAGIVIRAVMWSTYGSDGEGSNEYYTWIYYSSFCRFDELLAGVAVALLRNFHRDAWQRVMRHGRLAARAGVIVTAITFYLLLQDRYGFAMTVFGFPMLGLAFALLIVAALNPDTLLHRLRIPGAERLAIWSYAIYLMHKQIGILLRPELAKFGIGAGSIAGVAIILSLSVLGGWLLYRFVETPFMGLRERYFGSAAPHYRGAAASIY
jgi:peptidoglycan/LPS O-acetylase OafA/YrhL